MCMYAFNLDNVFIYKMVIPFLTDQLSEKHWSLILGKSFPSYFLKKSSSYCFLSSIVQPFAVTGIDYPLLYSWSIENAFNIPLRQSHLLVPQNNLCSTKPDFLSTSLEPCPCPSTGLQHHCLLFMDEFSDSTSLSRDPHLRLRTLFESIPEACFYYLIVYRSQHSVLTVIQHSDWRRRL